MIISQRFAFVNNHIIRNTGPMQKHRPVFSFGAGNGNRTRTVGLGSRSSTTKLYLHNNIIIHLCIKIKSYTFFIKVFPQGNICLAVISIFFLIYKKFYATSQKATPKMPMLSQLIILLIKAEYF